MLSLFSLEESRRVGEITWRMSVLCALCLLVITGQASSLHTPVCPNSLDQQIFAIPSDCSHYLRCVHGQAVVEKCPAGTYYNPSISQCGTSPLACLYTAQQPQPVTHVRSFKNIKPVAVTPVKSPENKRLLYQSELRKQSQLITDPRLGMSHKKLVCYYTNWAQYRQDPARFLPENIDPQLCTHIHYAYAKLDSNSQLAPYEWNDESTPWSVGMYEKVTKMKQKNPQLKVLLSLGGWNMGSTPFSVMVATEASRQQFIQTGIAYLRRWKFDGLSLEWEFPAHRGSPPDDKHRFTLLAQETIAAFEAESQKTGQARLLLTAAVSAGVGTIGSAYEIPKISKVFDYINLMSYDFFGAWDSVTGHVSPLYPPTGAQGRDKTFNVEFAANYWVSQGCPKEKLIIGLITYGRSFTLTNPAQSGRKAPASGPGNAGTYTREAGFMAYYEVCNMIKQGGKVVWLDDQKVPYVVLNNQWVGFENNQSLQLKAQFIIDNGFGGAMVWDLDFDDFNNAFCGQGVYPLISTIHKILTR